MTRKPQLNFIDLANQLSGCEVDFDEKEFISISFTSTLLADEHFSSTVPSIPNLVTLDCSCTLISDHALECFGEQPSLTDLLLDDTAITGSGFQRLSFPRLERLYLRDCKSFGRDGIENLTQFSNLERLYLGGTSIDNFSLEILGNFSKLKWLTLNDTEVTDAGIEHLVHLKLLENVWLENTQVSANGFQRLHDSLPNFRSFRM